MDDPMPCRDCGGVGWYTDHGDECYQKGDCTGGEGCPVQRPCETCKGQGYV